MSLLNDIQQASVEARKARNSNASFLVTLYSEAMMVGKSKRNGESTDEEVIAILKKFKANAETMIDAVLVLNNANAQLRIDEANNEIALVTKFLPKMLTEAELRHQIDLIKDMFTEQPSMGVIMGHLKSKYPGLYDGSLASRIIKEGIH